MKHIYFMKMQMKKCWGSNTYIRQKKIFKTKAKLRDKEGHCIMIKGTIQPKGITLVNIYECDTGSPKYKKNLRNISGETDRNTVIVGGLLSNWHQWIDFPDKNP